MQDHLTVPLVIRPEADHESGFTDCRGQWQSLATWTEETPC